MTISNPFSNFIRGSTTGMFPFENLQFTRNDSEWFSEWSEVFENANTGNYVFIQHSTSLLGGNLVDGSPPARHIEVVGGPYGRFGPGPIGARDLGNWAMKQKVIEHCPTNLLEFYILSLGFFWAKFTDEIMVFTVFQFLLEDRRIMILKK